MTSTILMLLCVFVSMVLTYSVREMVLRLGYGFSPMGGRHIHAKPVPRLGGIAIVASLLIVVPLVIQLGPMVGLRPPIDLNGFFTYIGPTLLVFALGIWDDLRNLKARTKFIVQIIAATWLYAEGIRIVVPNVVVMSWDVTDLLSWGATMLWVLWITNAFNLIDGLDGLAAGSALFSTVVIAVTALVGGNSPVAFLTIALAGSVAGFLRYNFNPATIFLGDCGSLTRGFLLSAVAIGGSAKSSTVVAVAIPLVSLGVPILEVAVAVGRRFLSGKPIFSADRDHFHHRLLDRGFSHRSAVLVLYGVTALFGLVSMLLLSPIARREDLVLVIIGATVFFGLQQLRYPELLELHRVATRTLSQRKIIANNVALRRSAEMIKNCSTFTELCMALQAALEPIGFHGFTVKLNGKISGQNGHLAAGRVARFYWSSKYCDPATCWSLSFPVEHECEIYGLFTLYRTQVTVPVDLDLNLLTNSEFAAAIGRVLSRLAHTPVPSTFVPPPVVAEAMQMAGELSS